MLDISGPPSLVKAFVAFWNMLVMTCYGEFTTTQSYHTFDWPFRRQYTVGSWNLGRGELEGLSFVSKTSAKETYL